MITAGGGVTRLVGKVGGTLEDGTLVCAGGDVEGMSDFSVVQAIIEGPYQNKSLEPGR